MKVFDASAIVALLEPEPGAEAVALALLDDEPWIGTVKRSETVG